MAHDHAVSKTEGKSAGVSARGKTGSHLPSGARSVLDLQGAAGNRAVARLLTAPASRVAVQRADGDASATGAVGPVSVQRDELVDALKREMGGQEVDFRQLAQLLLRGSENLAKGPMTPGRENKLAVKGKEAGASATTTTAKKLRTAGLAGAGLLPMEELLKREKELRRPVTPEEKAARDKQEELEELEKHQDEADELRQKEAQLRRRRTPQEIENAKKKAELDALKQQQKEAELRRELTPAEIAARDKKDELDDLEQKKKDDEELRQFERKRKKPLNPQNLTMNQLLGGRKF